MHVGPGRLYLGSARFPAVLARRTNILLIHVLMATRPPHTPDLRTTSRCLMSYSHNTAVRHEMDASRRAARSTRRPCRRSRTARSQHAYRRSPAISTRIVEHRGPSRREGSAWKDDGRALRPWYHRNLTRDSSGADSRERRRINAHDRLQAVAARAALEGQPRAAPRCACLKSLGDGGQRHRPPSTRAPVS